MLKKPFHFKVKKKILKHIFISSRLVKWRSCMSHSIVCHHVVCCGQMNQESRDTLLLIWQCSLTAQTQHMVLTTSWHSGPAVDDKLANICLQLFNNFHGHLKSLELLNRWRDRPPLGISCVVDHQRISSCFQAADIGIGQSGISYHNSALHSSLVHTWCNCKSGYWDLSHSVLIFK